MVPTINTSNGITPFNGKQNLPTIPWTDSVEIAKSPFGTSFAANGIDKSSVYQPRIENVHTTKYRGTGIICGAEGEVYDLESFINYVGIKLASSDIHVSRCFAYDNRDVNTWVARDAGNCQTTRVHNYGGRISFLNSAGGDYRSLGDTFADAFFGYLSWGWDETISNATFQYNIIRDIILAGNGYSFDNCKFKISKASIERTSFTLPDIANVIYGGITRSITGAGNRKVGIEVADDTTISKGYIKLEDTIHGNLTKSTDPVDAIWVPSGTKNLDIQTRLYDDQGINGAIGVKFLGATEGAKLDLWVKGLGGVDSRLLSFVNSSNCDGLDITIRLSGNPTSGPTKKTLADLVDIDTGWSGVPIKFFDIANKSYTELSVGSAA